jgi:hypothetical protein
VAYHQKRKINVAGKLWAFMELELSYRHLRNIGNNLIPRILKTYQSIKLCFANLLY